MFKNRVKAFLEENPFQQNYLYFLGIGIIIRLLCFVSDGHNIDLDCFEVWGQRAAQNGILNVYTTTANYFSCDYPPVYLYILGAVAKVYLWLDWPVDSYQFDSTLKLLTLAFELVCLHVIYRLTRNATLMLGLIFNPVIWIDAYAWGQIDVWYGYLILLSVLLFFNKKWLWAAFLIGISVSLKTQTLLFLPLFLGMLIKAEGALKHKIYTLLVFIVALLLPNVPFLLFHANPLISLEPHFTAAGRYNFISVNAFNVWWALYAKVEFMQAQSFPSGDTLFLFIKAKTLAYSVFAAIYGFILYKLLSEPLSRERTYLWLTWLSFSFFMWLPEMHERYLFCLFISFPLILSQHRSYKYIFVILLFLGTYNLIWAWGVNIYLYKYPVLFHIGRGMAMAMVVVWAWFSFILLKNTNVKAQKKPYTEVQG